MTLCDKCGEEISGPAHPNPEQSMENLCEYCYRDVKKKICDANRERNRRTYLGIMRNNKSWPRHPVLSLIRKVSTVKKEITEHAFLLSDLTYILYIENGCSISGCNKDIAKFIVMNMKQSKYPSFEAIVDDMWEVDPVEIKTTAGIWNN